MKLLDTFGLSIQATNVAATGHAAWASGTTYAENASVSYNDWIYVSLQDGNQNKVPSSSPAWWVKTYAEPYAAVIDGVVRSRSANALDLDLMTWEFSFYDYTVNLGADHEPDTLAFLNVEGHSIRVEVKSQDGLTTYHDETKLIGRDNTHQVELTYAVGGPYGTDVIFEGVNIPCYGLSPVDYPRVHVTITSATGVAYCGQIFLGKSWPIGITNEIPQRGIENYSVVEVDDFGRYSITPRDAAYKVSATVKVRDADLRDTESRLFQYKDVASVWYWAAGRPALPGACYGIPGDWLWRNTTDPVQELSLELLGMV